MNVTIAGAGVAGLCCAVTLAELGVRVEVLERAASLHASCAWHAAGMLAPGCESETADFPLEQLGRDSIEWWRTHVSAVTCNGTLVVAHARDSAELTRFAGRVRGCRWVGAEEIAQLEPDLAGRFTRALFFADEAHLDPRIALNELQRRLTNCGGHVRFGVDAAHTAAVDCRGLAARDVLGDLRGVKGEMLLLRSAEIELRRPVRCLHPRFPVYIVPRAEHTFMVGATCMESDAGTHVTARSMLELLSAACSVHPAFGEAQILEIGAQVRPAFPDHLPRIVRRGGVLYVNGLYRHGFLLGPAIARQAAKALLENAPGVAA